MRRRLCPLLLAFLFISVPAEAHHSFAAEFDYDRTGMIEGEILEVLFVNPHARYFVAIVNAEGEEEIWDAQTMSVSFLTRVGWTKDTIQVGERVSLQGNLGRGSARKLWIREVTRADGSKLYPAAGSADNDE